MHKYIHPLQQHYTSNSTSKKHDINADEFKNLLLQATDLKISKHAKIRMQERNIHIPKEKWAEITSKVNEAKVKGVTDALVVLDEATFVVSAKNNTVVTALNKSEAQDKIFTNINGTILI